MRRPDDDAKQWWSLGDSISLGLEALLSMWPTCAACVGGALLWSGYLQVFHDESIRPGARLESVTRSPSSPLASPR